MKSPARRLVARLVGIQVAAWGLTGLLVIAFAPPLLLLDATVVDGSVSLAWWGWLATVAVVAGMTLFVARNLRPVLDELASGDPQVAPTDVLVLHSLPARFVSLGVFGTLIVAAATLASPLRPATNDLWTQAELVMLAVTMASVAALPAYVAMRASVTKTVELVPVATSRAAIELLDTRRSSGARLKHRLLAAVVAPVAFVSLGASLLVHAQLRAVDAYSREDEAMELARGVFGSLAGDSRGAKEAIEEASARGFYVELDRSAAVFGKRRDEYGNTVVSVPLVDGHGVVR
ncbi:MAG: hypothetical protein M3O46_17540, partial [Myxococcota bacterium]|nr:hypothetical protein [Myxococcota bacterium]